MADQVMEATEQIQELRVDQITPNPYQPRERFDEAKLQELADSITEQGLQEPIVVRPNQSEPGQWQLVMGERRLRAFQLLGRETIPAIVREVESGKMEELALIENIQREDLTIMEEARSLAKLKERLGSLTLVAQKIGKEKNLAYVSRRLALLELPQEIQLMIEEEKIRPVHADVILDIEGAHNQLEAAKLAAKLNLTAAQLHGRMLRHMKPKVAEGGPKSAGVVKFGHISGGVVRLYDAVEGFNFGMLRDADKREMLKRQLKLLKDSLDTAIAKLDLPVEELGVPSKDGDGESD